MKVSVPLPKMERIIRFLEEASEDESIKVLVRGINVLPLSHSNGSRAMLAESVWDNGGVTMSLCRSKCTCCFQSLSGSFLEPTQWYSSRGVLISHSYDVSNIPSNSFANRGK